MSVGKNRRFVNALSIGKDDIFGDSIQQVYLGSDITTGASAAKLRQTIGGAATLSTSSGVGKSEYSVRALSYCDIHKIMLDDLCAILNAYPEFSGDFLQKFTVTFNLRKVKLSSNYIVCQLADEIKTWNLVNSWTFCCTYSRFVRELTNSHQFTVDHTEKKSVKFNRKSVLL